MKTIHLIVSLLQIYLLSALQPNSNICQTGSYFNTKTENCHLCSTKTQNCLTCDQSGNCLSCRGPTPPWLDITTQLKTCTCLYGQIRVFNITTSEYLCVDWQTALSQFNPATVTKLGKSVSVDQLKAIYSITLYLNQYEHEVESPTQLIASHLLYAQQSIMDTSEKIEILASIFAAFGILPIKQYESYNPLVQLTQMLMVKSLTTAAIDNLFEFLGLLSEKIGKNGGLDFGTSDSTTIITFLNNVQNQLDNLKQVALTAYTSTIQGYSLNNRFQLFRYSNLWVGIFFVNKSEAFFSSLKLNEFTFSASLNVIKQFPSTQNIWFVQIVQEFNIFQYLPNNALNLGSSIQNIQFYQQNQSSFTKVNNFTNVNNNVIMGFQINANQFNSKLYYYISQNSSWSTNGVKFNSSISPSSLSYSLFGIQAQWKTYSCNQGEYQFSYSQCEVCEYRTPGCLTCNQQTAACLTCSGLVPAWTNIGNQQTACTCPKSQILIKNSSYFCTNATIAASYWNSASSEVMAMSGTLTNAQLQLLKVLAYTINGNNSLLYLNIIAKKFAAGITLTNHSQLQQATEILLALSYNSESSYQILNNIIQLPYQIAISTYCDSTILKQLMEHFGLIFQKISQPTFDFSSATDNLKAQFLSSLVLAFNNVKRKFIQNNNIIANSYHFTSLYLNAFKGILASQNFSSTLFQAQYQLNLNTKSLQKLQLSPISALHVVSTQNFFANYPQINSQIPTNLMLIDFYQGSNYAIANSFLKSLSPYSNTMIFQYLCKTNLLYLYLKLGDYSNISLNYWQQKYPLSVWTAQDNTLYTYTQNNVACYFDSLAYSTIYTIKLKQ